MTKMTGDISTVLLFYLSSILLSVNYVISLETYSNVSDSCINNSSFVQEYETKCLSCPINMFESCKGSDEKLTKGEGTPGCQFVESYGIGPNKTRDGCTHTCKKVITVESCCSGYWGENCKECPGGTNNTCNGNGFCIDGKNGTGVCNCTDNWMGYSCELCKNETACGNTTAVGSCQNHTCPNNSACVDVGDEEVCTCTWPYVSVNKGDNGTLTCEDITKDVDVCTYPPICHQNATCTSPENITRESLLKKCTCNKDFFGDGFDCDLFDPCQVNHGGCDLDKEICITYEPGKSKCLCSPGFHKETENQNCTVTDMCSTMFPACHAKANCKTVAPLTRECTCQDGYEGNGEMCYGNIMKTIEDLDDGVIDAELSKRLGLIKTAMEKFYYTELTQHGTFTIFLPMDEGFGLKMKEYENWLNDESRAKQVLRQHIIVGEFKIEDMLNESGFYSLQGTAAQLIVSSRGSIRYKLGGERMKARIVKADVIASNGIIHVVNKLMTNDPEVAGNPQKTLLELIESNGQYNKLQALVAVAGSEITDLLNKANMTMFVANNGIWESLPEGSLDFLKSPEGIGSLKAILKNLMHDGIIEIAELIDTPRITSLSGTTFEMSVTKKGRVQLDGAINITHADIVAKNGLLMEVDAIPIPEGYSTLPNFCYNTSFKTEVGPCVDCRESRTCQIGVPIVNTECTYMRYDVQRMKYEERVGCSVLCNVTVKEQQCCEGFYGEDCLPCKGGYKNPCSGNGKCLDGKDNNGTCQCDPKFAGELCNQCSKSSNFGPNCTQECTCLHGECDNGPSGNGLCRHDEPCQFGFVGSNCDKKLALCPHNQQTMICHAHSFCTLTDYGNRCVCNKGYKMNGETCEELDPCLEPYRGHCDKQATCTKTGPGQAACSCNQGWTGNGHYCYRASACRHHADCSVNAVCIDAANQHICQCRSGYHGNGTSCIQEDICVDNAAGCHPKATCTATGPGKANCTCKTKEGYVGTGYHCYGDLVQQILDHPNLTYVSQMLQHASKRKLEIITDFNYTIFIPDDEAMMKFRMKYPINHYHFKTENLITIMNYHMLMNGTKIEVLAAMDNYTKLETMQDGFNLHIQKDGNFYYLTSPVTGTHAKILEQNIIATNGYLNIIDEVLEPYLPTNPDDYPLLSEFFDQHPEYSTFAKWFKERNLTQRLEDEFQAYTLFVPNNEAADKLKQTVTTNYLLYYVIPTMQLTASVEDGETYVTSLGQDHQLVYNVLSWENVFINNVHIEKQDIFTYGGLVNGISSLLHPVLHECDENVHLQPFLTQCAPCYGSITCPDKYTLAHSPPTKCLFNPFIDHYPFGERNPFSDNFWPFGPSDYYRSHDLYRYSTDGCQGLCVPIEKIGIKGCCAGYFGSKCTECPGGPEFPCSSHGRCDDKINGTGVCACQPHFTGKACESCIDGWTGSNCNIDKSGCGYLNGGCHANAGCDLDYDGIISCSCLPGYHGNGYNCTGPCDVNNGGCHDNASCSFKVTTGKLCSCQPGFYGDGKVWCNGDILSTLQKMDTANIFLKSFEQWFSDFDNTSNNVQFTLFIPDDQSFNDKALDEQTFLSHVVKSNTTITLNSGKAENLTVTTISGKALFIWFNTNKGVFYVNQAAVIEGNIPCKNGMIHLLSTPLARPSRARSTSAPPIGAIVGAIFALLVITMVIAGSVVAYKRSKFRYWKLMQSWYPRRKQSQNSGLETPLNFNEPDDDSTSCGSPAANTNFGNPLFQTEDLE